MRTDSRALLSIHGAVALLLSLLLQVAVAGDYAMEVLVVETPLHGANGMDFDADGDLIAGSMMSASVFHVDTETGAVETIVGPPRGVADDLAIGPDGTLVWTSTPFGIVHVLRPGGKVERLATDLPMINSINFTRDGRLFAAQVTVSGGNLYELDVTGQTEPRLVLEDLPGLNSFEIDDNNILFGPLQWGGKIIRIDLKTAAVKDVATGFSRPVAVNFDSHGNLYAVDYLSGEIIRVDPESGSKQVVAKVNPPIDNLAIDRDDRVYIAQPCGNGIREVDVGTGTIRQVARGSIGMPGGAILMQRNGRETLLVAGMLCQNFIDTQTGEFEALPRQGETIWSGWLDYSNGTLVLSSLAFGQLQWLDAATGQPRKTLAGFKAPYAVKIMPDNSVWMAEHGTGRILRLTEAGGQAPEVLLDGLGGPVEFLEFEKNKLYVSEADAGRVSMHDILSGERVVVVDDLDQPEGIDRLPDGRLLIAEVGARRLIAVDTDTGAIEVIAENLPVGLPPFMGTAKTFLPTDVIVNPHGIIYLVSDIDHTVLKFTPSD
jgi:sugar lactone lactonase YvrE